MAYQMPSAMFSWHGASISSSSRSAGFAVREAEQHAAFREASS